MNVQFPGTWSCYVRTEYLRDLKDMQGTAVPCTVDSLVSLPGRMLQANVRLTPVGALVDRVPLSGLVHRVGDLVGNFPARGGGNSDIPVYETDAPTRPYHHTQPLACFTVAAAASERELLALRAVDCRVGGRWVRGAYLLTVDWPVDSYGDDGHKCAHVVALHDGTYVAYPNNMVCSLDAATVSAPLSVSGKIPDIRLRTYNFSVEEGWTLEHGDAAFYEVEDSASSGG